MTEPITHTVEAPSAVLTYDIREPETPSKHRPLFIFGSPMGASGFEQLVSHFGDRTVITYDPRGMERSTREPNSELTAEVHAEDYHRVIEAARLGPVDAFGSSGGGMCALHWVLAHPEDVRTLVSHEPPLVALLEDREMAIKVNADIVETYQREGFGPAMAKFIQVVMHQGPLPDN
ncbi:MAG TPA: alpha/beta fold hydrolase, partial [Jiangellaceae bacterium]